MGHAYYNVGCHEKNKFLCYLTKLVHLYSVYVRGGQLDRI